VKWDAFMDDFQQTLDKVQCPHAGAGRAKGNRSGGRIKKPIK